MSRFGKNIGGRILAYLLSSAMIMSNMTAFASEPSPDTVGRYVYEQEADDDTAKESDDGDAEIAEEIENNVNDIADSEDDADSADSEKEDNEENNKGNENQNSAVDKDNKNESLEDDKDDNKNESPEDDKDDNEKLNDGIKVYSDGNEDEEDDPEEEAREAASTIVWDFQNNQYKIDGTAAGDLKTGFSTIQNIAGTLKGLIIDATSGKFDLRGSDAQLNNNTSVKIPVYGKSKVTIVAYSGYNNYKVDDKAPDFESIQNVGDKAEFIGVGDYAELKTTGTQYLYSITVDKYPTAKVTGSVTLTPAATEAVKVIFTEKVTEGNPAVVEAEIGADGSYEANLFVGSTYTVTLSNKDYTVAQDCAEIVVGENDTTGTLNITASAVTTNEVTGNIVFPADVTAPSDLEIAVSAGNHNPDVTIAGDTYTVNLEPGKDYTVTATGTHINDYTYTTTINTTSNDITFTEKPKYGVNITVDSFDKKTNGSSLELTFTNTNEAGYSYDFTGTDNVSLRNGTYSLKIKDLSYPYIDASETLTVNGTNEDYTIRLSERMKWDFTHRDYALEIGSISNKNYHGLDITGSVRIADSNVEISKGTVIKIPVSGKGTVKISLHSHQYADGCYTMKDTPTDAQEKTWNYNTFDKTSADYLTGGYMVMSVPSNIAATPYLNTITVTREEEAPEGGGSTGSEESSDPEESGSEPPTSPATESYVTAGKKDFQADLKANPSLAFETNYPGITFNNFNLLTGDGKHGFHTSETETPTMVLNLSKKADITVEACVYWSTGADAPERDLGITSGELTSADTDESGPSKGQLYTITGASKGKLTITFGHGLYIHNIEVSYPYPDDDPEDESSTATEESSDVDTSTEENSEVDDSDEEESQPIKDDTVEDKIKADPDAPKKTIKMSDTDAIKIQAADIVENKKYTYAVSVTYTYTSEEIKDGKPVTYQQQLTEGVHYEVEKKENSDGSCYVMVYGLGETDLGIFVGSAKSNNYTIWTSKDVKENKAKDLSKAKIKLDYKSATFTGNYITPGVTVTDPADKTKNLTEGTDYTVVYKNNVNVGKASVTVIGTKGETGYFGSTTATFSIKAAPLAKSTVNIKADNIKEGLVNDAGKKGKVTAEEKTKGDFTYTGEAITFKNLTLELVSNEGKTVSKLSPSTYTVTYKKNTAKGTATATIKGLNNVSGAITVSYEITNAVDGDAIKALTTSTAATPLDGEYSSKGVRLTEIKVGNVTLKENVDYKADYKECAKTAELNKVETVSISGLGSYKKVFDKVPVQVKTEQGKFHLKKSGVTVDKSKIYDKKSGALDAKKLISTAKITDASGATIKPEAIDTAKIKLRNNKITLTPSDTTNYKKSELTDLHVATKITAALKQNKDNVLKGYFDGVNTVTTTETAIVNTLTKLTATPAVLTTPVITKNDISIVSYKNNHKLGNATVTIQAADNSAYYGTMNVKFTITAVSGANRVEGSDDPDDPDDPDISGTIAEGTLDFTSHDESLNNTLVTNIDGITANEIYYHASNHGLNTKGTEASMTLNLEKDKKAELVLTTCGEGAGAEATISVVDASGKTYEAPSVEVAEGSKKGKVFTIAEASGTVTITFTNTSATTYIHSLKVTYKEDGAGGDDDGEQPDADGFYDGFKATSAVEGRSYYFDFATEYASVGANTPISNSIENGLFSFDAGNTSQAVYNGATYGVEFKTNNKLTFKVAGNSFIVVGGDNNSNCEDLAAASTSGTLSPTTLSTNTSNHATLENCKNKGANTLVYKYTGNAGTVDLTLNGSGVKAYIAYVCVIPNTAADEEVNENNNFKIWLDNLAQDGTVATGAREYPSGTVTLIGKGETQFTQSYSNAINVVRDGETHSGYKAGDRPSSAGSISSVPNAGAGCCVVFESKKTGMFKIYFQSTSYLRVHDFNTETGTKIGYNDSQTSAEFYAFDVEPGHTYVMTPTSTNNMAYIGYQFIQNMNIEVETELHNVDADVSALDALELTFTDALLGTKMEDTTVKKNTEKITLLKYHTYEITSNDGSVRAEVGGKDTFTVTSDDKITFDLYKVDNETLTGEITGTPAGTVTKLKFVNMVNGSEFEATVTDTTYSCTMKPGEYNTVVETTNGGTTYDRVSVKAGAENVNEVYVEVPDPSKAKTYAPADIVELEQTGLTLRDSNGGDVMAKNGAEIKVPVTGKAKVTIETYNSASYKVNDNPKEYTNTTGSTNNNQSDTVTVDGDCVIKVTGAAGTTYFRKITVSPVIEFKSELNVPGDYKTLNEAFDAIASMERPEGETGRVTVNLNKDIREQVALRASYVTLKGNNHTIDWYYGMGTLYYSVDPSTGLYSERLARDRYSSAKVNENLWGGAFLVYGDNFIAEDTTFKNTYNYELTNEEKTDIAGTALVVSRLTEGAKVTDYAYKERSNAFYIGADKIECYNCKILSSQDGLGRNGSDNNGYHVYFKDCVIGGNVDYICGEFAAVFDNCELQWKTFSDGGNNNTKIGYIVAPKTNPYVFRNCIVTTDKTVDGVLGWYGRTWGEKSNASFINTETNGYIKTDGWDEMSNSGGPSAIFKEYGNTSKGTPFATTGSWCTAEDQTHEAVKDYIDEGTTPKIITDVLGGWKPVHYSYEPDRKGPANSGASE